MANALVDFTYSEMDSASRQPIAHLDFTSTPLKEVAFHANQNALHVKVELIFALAALKTLSDPHLIQRQVNV